MQFFAFNHHRDDESPKRRLPLIQRRVSVIDHLRPQRWNWHLLVKPLDASLEKSASEPLAHQLVVGLRYFWLDGVFSSISENFFLSFIPLFALVYGATNGEIGWLTAIGNLLGAISLFPGASAVEKTGKRKLISAWTGGGLGRLTLLGLAILPFVLTDSTGVIWAIILLNGLRAFMGNFGNPAWTAMVADLVPGFMRGKYFGSRNMAMGAAALVVAPLAGWIINFLNRQSGSLVLGYQAVFLLSFVTGMISTALFLRIPEPESAQSQAQTHKPGDLRRALKQNPEFVWLVISTFVWNLSLQVAGPFFNVYLVKNLGAGITLVGAVTGISSLSALAGQWYFGRQMDKKGTLWVQNVTGFLIPTLPIAWAIIDSPEWVFLINLLGGFWWAGYNLSNFNLLLEMTPDAQRPRMVALFQTAVFSSAVVGPLLGGYIADAINFQWIFSVSGVGRFVAMLIFVWFVVRPLNKKQAVVAA